LVTTCPRSGLFGRWDPTRRHGGGQAQCSPLAGTSRAWL
jgi:hypothetical protein